MQRTKNYVTTLDPHGDLSALDNLRATVRHANKILRNEKLRVCVKARWGKNNPHYKTRTSDYFCPPQHAQRLDVYVYNR